MGDRQVRLPHCLTLGQTVRGSLPWPERSTDILNERLMPARPQPQRLGQFGVPEVLSGTPTPDVHVVHRQTPCLMPHRQTDVKERW